MKLLNKVVAIIKWFMPEDNKPTPNPLPIYKGKLKPVDEDFNRIREAYYPNLNKTYYKGKIYEYHAEDFEPKIYYTSTK